ncbi:MAG: hypothetical protein WC755_03390 [Candidatus Woesearchaeota archaeon]|jgi:hypothetical protein
MGEDTSSFMGVNLIKYVLLALVLVIAIIAVVRWTSSINQDEISFKADNSFLRLVSVVGKVEKNNMTSYTRVSFSSGEGVAYKYIENSLEKFIGCNVGKNCICIIIPDEGDKRKVFKCKEVNSKIYFETKILYEEDTLTTSDCVGNNMYDCNSGVFRDEDDYVLSYADVKISKDKSTNTVNLIFTGTIK